MDTDGNMSDMEYFMREEERRLKEHPENRHVLEALMKGIEPTMPEDSQETEEVVLPKESESVPLETPPPERKKKKERRLTERGGSGASARTDEVSGERKFVGIYLTEEEITAIRFLSMMNGKTYSRMVGSMALEKLGNDRLEIVRNFKKNVNVDK